VNAQARAGVEQALLAILRARDSDRVWSIAREGELAELLDASAGEVSGGLTAPEDVDAIVKGSPATDGGPSNHNGIDRARQQRAPSPVAAASSGVRRSARRSSGVRLDVGDRQ
jgi:hypothetical protein